MPFKAFTAWRYTGKIEEGRENIDRFDEFIALRATARCSGSAWVDQN